MIRCKCGNKYPLGTVYCNGCGRAMTGDYNPPRTIADLKETRGYDGVVSYTITETNPYERMYSISSREAVGVSDFGKRETQLDITVLNDYFDKIFQPMGNGMHNVILTDREGVVQNFKGYIQEQTTAFASDEYIQTEVSMMIMEHETYLEAYDKPKPKPVSTNKTKKFKFDACGICGSDVTMTDGCTNGCAPYDEIQKALNVCDECGSALKLGKCVEICQNV